MHRTSLKPIGLHPALAGTFFNNGVLLRDKDLVLLPGFLPRTPVGEPRVLARRPVSLDLHLHLAAARRLHRPGNVLAAGARLDILAVRIGHDILFRSPPRVVGDGDGVLGTSVARTASRAALEPVAMGAAVRPFGPARAADGGFEEVADQGVHHGHVGQDDGDKGFADGPVA